MNLTHDGAHDVARMVIARAQALQTTQSLWISPRGTVTIASTDKPWRPELQPPDAHMVGSYTGSASARLIWGDIEAHTKGTK